ncbi:hypothetical protein JCM10213v2_006558 [Rhodosporidiobolus nylandii]
MTRPPTRDASPYSQRFSGGRDKSEKFHSDYTSQRESGGRLASRKIHKLVEAELAHLGELLAFYLPLPFVSTVFLGSVHDDNLIDQLPLLPPEQHDKLILLGTEASRGSRLFSEGAFKALQVEEGLFVAHRPSSERVNANGNGRVRPPQKTWDSPPARARFTPTSEYPPPLPVSSGPFEPPRLYFPRDDKPCRDFYLYADGCGKGSKCRFNHAYPFTQQEWLDFPKHVKGQLCHYVSSPGGCKWGEGPEGCYMGHRCPFTADLCPFGAQCRFLRAGLPHSVEEKQEVGEEKQEIGEGEDFRTGW